MINNTSDTNPMITTSTLIIEKGLSPGVPEIILKIGDNKEGIPIISDAIVPVNIAPHEFFNIPYEPPHTDKIAEISKRNCIGVISLARK